MKNAGYAALIRRIIESDFIPFEKIKGKRFFITGATGMIGNVIVDVLQLLNSERNYGMDITVLTRNAEKAAKRFTPSGNGAPEIKYLEQDITAPFPNDLRADYIFCAASTSHPLAFSQDPFGTIEINLAGTRNCIQLAKNNNGARVVFFSSGEIYGENKNGLECFREEDCGYINCNNMRACYNESKRLCECLMQTALQKYAIDFVTVRMSRIFGPTMLMEDSKASSQFIKNALAKQDIVLKSDGKQRFSYVFVPDVVTGIFTVLLKGNSGEAYNISGDPVHLYEFAKACADFAGTKVVFAQASKIEAAGYSLAKDSVLSTEKLRKLGWGPRYSVREGLKETIEILSCAE